MPQKLTVNFLYPSTNRVVPEKRKIRLDGPGELSDEKGHQHIALVPNYAYNSGREVFVDAEKGIQVMYAGAGRWVGIDGRYTYAAQVKKDAKDLQTRGIDYAKYTWPVIVFVLGVMAALVAALAFTTSRGG